MRTDRSIVMAKIARDLSERSTCLRKKVGCLVTRDNRIIATGYNGVPSGVDHCIVCEGPGCSNAIHAEAGLISFCAKEGISLKGTTMYVTLSPCENCANLIINSGITQVVYTEKYRCNKGLIKLRKNNIREVYINVKEM